MKASLHILNAALLGFGLFPSTSVAAEGPPMPRLVLQITIDQLRGDLPRRYLANMGSGGFRYLLEQAYDQTTHLTFLSLSPQSTKTDLKTGFFHLKLL